MIFFSWICNSTQVELMSSPDTIQNFFQIEFPAFKKGASYFDNSFRFSGLWLILVKDLGRSGQNKSWGTERAHGGRTRRYTKKN